MISSILHYNQQMLLHFDVTFFDFAQNHCQRTLEKALLDTTFPTNKDMQNNLFLWLTTAFLGWTLHLFSARGEKNVRPGIFFGLAVSAKS